MSSLPILKQFLGENLSAAEDLRARIPNNRSITTAPLDKRVIVDWTGARIGLNHQKSVVVSHQGKLTALVTGLDFKQHAYDQCPHDTLRIGKTRWGWHDAAALVTGPITESIWENFMLCWKEVSTLPKRYERVSGLKYELVNLHMLEEFSDAPKQTPINNPDVSMQTLRSFGEWKVGSLLPHRRSRWSLLPRQGIQEVYACFTKALQGASRYIYIEDQFLKEIIGGKSDYELYPFLKDAAERGVKVILLGSGVHGFIWKSKVSSRVSKDIQKKFLDQLKPTEQHNVAVHHLKHVQTHSKIVLVDDEFASVGSANMFSRSMAGIDHELNVALVTTGNQVRDLRVKLWGEHLRSSMDDPDYLNALRDQGIALGIWRPEWLPETESTETWRKAGIPKGFAPTEQVLKLVGPK